MIPTLVAVGVIVVVLILVMSSYNGLVSRSRGYPGPWAQIDVVAQAAAHDLIPNLVETVKGYAAHEKDTLTAVIAARNQAASSTANAAQASQAEGQLTGALRQLFAVAESYPDLKANTNFLELQRELSNTENQIGQTRQQYNALVASYNTAILSFPNSLLAGLFGFHPQPFFEIQDAVQREAPVVKF